MNRTVLRRVAAPCIATLALGLAVSACGAGNESSTDTKSSLSGTIKGAGSSAQEAAMKAWRAGFQTDNPKVTVNYDPSGSGAGVEQFNAGAIDFAASDAALDPTKGEVDAAKARCGGQNALEVPSYVSPIAVVFKLSGVDKLNLSAKTIADIFSGKVTKWNDAEIAADNDGVTLPSTAITTVHRGDESGTTKNFTDYLNKAGEGAWKFDPDKVWPLKTGEAATGTSGVIAAIKDGSIGYADESQAGDLSKASIKVGDVFTAPSAEGAAKALEVSPLDDTRTEGDLAIKVDRTTTEAGAYPLFLASYVIACPTYDSAKLDLVKGFLKYVVSTDGQKAAATNAGSAPLPAALQTKAAAIIDTIAAK
ncbi:MAG: phosphate ABC transporter substrate-binding protein PstS [Marmoricola sp.]